MSALLGFTVFVTMLGVGIIAPFLPLYADKMGASSTMLGLIFGSLAGARLLATPYVGEMSDRRGRKWFMVCGLAMLGLTALGYLAAQQPWHLVLVRIAQGVSASMVLPVAMALVADATVQGQEGRGMGNFNFAFMLGWGLGPLLGGVIYDVLGLNANFWILVALSLAGAALAAVRLREPAPTATKNTPSGHVWRNSLALLRDRTTTLALICRAGAAIQTSCVVAFFPLLGRDLNLPLWQVGGFITVNVMVTTFMQNPAGRLADRFAKPPLVLTGQFISGLGMVLLPFAHDFTTLAVLAVVMGIGGGLALPAVTALVVTRGKAMGKGMGVVMGMFNTAFSFGVMVGPVTAGWLGDLTVHTAAFYFAGAVCVLSAFGILFAKA